MLKCGGHTHGQMHGRGVHASYESQWATGTKSYESQWAIGYGHKKIPPKGDWGSV
jgi:hypothetical protein